MNAFMNVPLRVASATSTLMIGVTASAGALVYLFAGDVSLTLVAPVALAVLVGSVLAVHLGSNWPRQRLAVFVRRGARARLDPPPPESRGSGGMTATPDGALSVEVRHTLQAGIVLAALLLVIGIGLTIFHGGTNILAPPYRYPLSSLPGDWRAVPGARSSSWGSSSSCSLRSSGSSSRCCTLPGSGTFPLP